MRHLIAPAVLVVALAASAPAFAYNDFDALADAAWGLYYETSQSAGHAQFISFADEDAANAAEWGSSAWEAIQSYGSCNGQSVPAYDWINSGWGNLDNAANAGPADYDDPDAFWSWYSDANWIVGEVQWYLDTYIGGC